MKFEVTSEVPTPKHYTHDTRAADVGNALCHERSFFYTSHQR